MLNHRLGITQDQKDKWIASLRDPDSKQRIGSYGINVTDKCAVGWLLAQKGVMPWSSSTKGKSREYHATEHLITDMNDKEHMSLVDISYWIEEHVIADKQTWWMDFKAWWKS